jgi:hypothetical protein
MKLTDFQKEISKLDKSKRIAILTLIDLKTESDMEKALSEIRNIKDSMNFKMNTVMWVVGVLSAIILAAISLLMNFINK